MITEDYVSLEIAKLLKEKGFNEICAGYYDRKGRFDMTLSKVNNIRWEGHYIAGNISAPTLQMTMKWLREKEYAINIDCMDKCFTYKYYIKHINNTDKHTDFKHYNTYESACEAAIKYCLEHLI